jgi:hypothetical protein
MAQKKNCDKRRQENLPKPPSKEPAVSRQPTVEDNISYSKSDVSDNDFTPDSVTRSDLSVDDSEFDMESDDDEDNLKEI